MLLSREKQQATNVKIKAHMNYLNRKISGYNRVDDLKGGIVTVGTFLRSTKNIESIELIRSEKDEKKQSALKKELLPCATISGIFDPLDRMGT